jgi:hypothetical protein
MLEVSTLTVDSSLFVVTDLLWIGWWSLFFTKYFLLWWWLLHESNFNSRSFAGCRWDKSLTLHCCYHNIRVSWYLLWRIDLSFRCWCNNVFETFWRTVTASCYSYYCILVTLTLWSLFFILSEIDRWINRADSANINLHSKEWIILARWSLYIINQSSDENYEQRALLPFRLSYFLYSIPPSLRQ